MIPSVPDGADDFHFPGARSCRRSSRCLQRSTFPRWSGRSWPGGRHRGSWASTCAATSGPGSAGRSWMVRSPPTTPWACTMPGAGRIKTCFSVTGRCADSASGEQLVGQLGSPQLVGSYFTFSDENNYQIWAFLKKCWERGMVYKGHDVMPWCPRCSTGISEHEIVTEGYQEKTHPGVFLRFPLVDRADRSLLVWTTTPWTLTSNVAAAVHPDLVYAVVRQGREELVLAEGTLGALSGDYTVVERLPGSRLVGARYRGPFDDLPPQRGIEHHVIPWKDVGAEEGRGIVHIAPGCGAHDYAVSKRHG